MSEQYPGGFISKTPPTPAGPYQDSSAYGMWTLSQAAGYQKQGLWPVPGATNPNAFIENLFSTWLYTGNGTSQTITNGINLSGQGGLVWIKARNTTTSNSLFDTVRGGNYRLLSDTAGVQTSYSGNITSFNSNGFSIGDNNYTNQNTYNYASWTFREQPKFFDVVTYNGDGVPGRQIAHNLGSAPGCIIVKNTNVARDWAVWHRSLADGTYLKLNTTDATITNTSFQVFGDASGQTSSVFTVGKTGSGVNGLTNANALGETYVAYLFAHDAGGFGLSGTENVISCGSYVGNGSGTGPVVTLGYEPQWLLIKAASDTGNWYILDNIRGIFVGSADPRLFANTADAEDLSTVCSPTATGFQLDTAGAPNGNGVTYIYVAIRRGPMQTPTVGTSVFAPIAFTGNGGTNTQTTNFPVDFYMHFKRAGADNKWTTSRLAPLSLATDITDAETTPNLNAVFQNNTGLSISTYFNSSATTYVLEAFRRAPGFFDVVCYTGNGVNARAITHNLTVAPELIIVKNRTGAGSQGWVVWASGLTSRLYELYLNGANAQFVEASPRLNVNNAPTSTQFEVGTDGEVNASSATYVAYLFATVAGVSKVGSYTGTGATLNIDAGFTTGARFVMIKRINSTGNWFVWDTARGMVSGTDPRLALNSTAAESNADWVYTATSGFQIVTTDASVNASGGTYIYLAIA